MEKKFAPNSYTVMRHVHTISVFAPLYAHFPPVSLFSFHSRIIDVSSNTLADFARLLSLHTKANNCEDPYIRMLYVTTFAVTCFAGTDRKGTYQCISSLLKPMALLSIQGRNPVPKVAFVSWAKIPCWGSAPHFLAYLSIFFLFSNRLVPYFISPIQTETDPFLYFIVSFPHILRPNGFFRLSFGSFFWIMDGFLFILRIASTPLRSNAFEFG